MVDQKAAEYKFLLNELDKYKRIALDLELERERLQKENMQLKQGQKSEDENKGLRIFISGPYSAENEQQRAENAVQAVDCGIELIRKGHFPFVPHLMHWLDKRAVELGVEFSWQDFMHYDGHWLKQCDAILYLGSSKGADIEFAAARDLGLEVYYSTEEVPAAK